MKLLYLFCATALALSGTAMVQRQPQSQTSIVSTGTATNGAPSTPGDLSLTELMKRVEAGNASAENELALRYRYGAPGVEKDRDKALEWFRKAAKDGSAKAAFNLGVAYYNGDGLPANPDEACKWFLISADAGDSAGREAFDRSRQEGGEQGMVACMTAAADTYLRGKEHPTDYVRALDFYRQAAAHRYIPAEERLAEMYDRGLGVPVDKTASFQHLQRAADLGSPSASYLVARTYQAASNKDPKQAMKWFEKAALQQFPAAMMALGDMYRNGDGVTADIRKAYMWYLLAGVYGSPDAQKTVDSLGSQLSAKQVADAKTQAKKYVANMHQPLTMIHK
jgi:TPR repeat protein